MPTQIQSVQQQVIQLISRIQGTTTSRASESREINRQKITIPVTIRRFKDDNVIEAISRDFSSLGIGLLSNQPITVGEVCELELELDSTSSKLVATSQYCKPFGKGYFITGWRFDNITS